MPLLENPGQFGTRPTAFSSTRAILLPGQNLFGQGTPFPERAGFPVWSQFTFLLFAKPERTSVSLPARGVGLERGCRDNLMPFQKRRGLTRQEANCSIRQVPRILPLRCRRYPNLRRPARRFCSAFRAPPAPGGGGSRAWLQPQSQPSPPPPPWEASQAWSVNQAIRAEHPERRWLKWSEGPPGTLEILSETLGASWRCWCADGGVSGRPLSRCCKHIVDLRPDLYSQAGEGRGNLTYMDPTSHDRSPPLLLLSCTDSV